MTTTYQLTADSMIDKYGRVEGLAMAVEFSTAPWIENSTRVFWGYVAQCIRQSAYECDSCGRRCLRTHKIVAYGTDTIACDACVNYEPEAYGEPRDPLLESVHE